MHFLHLLAAIAVRVFLCLAIYFAVLVVCGLYDVSRNKKCDRTVVKRYFNGNGVFTWVMSPLNTLLDIMALPYINKGVYQLQDLPKGHQAEIQKLIDAASAEDLIGKLEELIKNRKRTMVFFKWYGQDVNTSVDVPAFHEKYKYIQTIGISVFNKKQSTSKHFGPLRASLRVLYNINDTIDDSAYIVVGNVTNYWRTNKLFIFDDTLMHQSFNESDRPRYCLFVDILRPSMITGVFTFAVGVIQYLMRSINAKFYRQWDVIKN